MTVFRSIAHLFLIVALLCTPTAAEARDVPNQDPELVYVADPNNDADLDLVILREIDPQSGEEISSEEVAATGEVEYGYLIGRTELTAAQYTRFLNAVAANDDPESLDSLYYPGWAGELIDQLGERGSFTYRVAAGRGDHPMYFITWNNAARFANWMHYGQPDGDGQEIDLDSGSYRLGSFPPERTEEATWVIPNQNEWYKAAYFTPDLDESGLPGYTVYATGYDSAPVAEPAPTDGKNSANFNHVVGATTSAYEYDRTRSYYGTIGQSGNVAELMEHFSNTCAWNRGGNYQSTEIGISKNMALFICILELGLDTRVGSTGVRMARLEHNPVAPYGMQLRSGNAFEGALEDAIASDDSSMVVESECRAEAERLDLEFNFNVWQEERVDQNMLDLVIEGRFGVRPSTRLRIAVFNFKTEEFVVQQTLSRPEPVEKVHLIEGLPMADFVDNRSGEVRVRFGGLDNGCGEVVEPGFAIAIDRISAQTR